jgi:TolA-binding protein
MPGIQLMAQDTSITAVAQSDTSLLEQVYGHRISLLQDSLFLTHEQLEAANFLVKQLEEQSVNLTDSLALVYTQVEQLTDSLSQLFIQYDRARSDNEQNLARLEAVGDSLTQSYQREEELLSMGDSLRIILARTQSHLGAVSGSQRAFLDTVTTLRDTLAVIRQALASSDERAASMYERLRTLLVSQSGGKQIDSAVDESLVDYLQQVADFRLEASGLKKLFQSREEVAEVYAYKLKEYTEYLRRVALLGHAQDVLNLLAASYIEQDEPIRGILTYLKTLFIYHDTEAGMQAISQLDELVEEEGEFARLYREVALNPDSMDVGEEGFHRYFHYLSHIRKLSDLTATGWFIDEARQFLTMYPSILQADEILVWIGHAYHLQEQFHSEILTYQKIRTMHPSSSYMPDITYTIAAVTANDLKDYAAGAQRYASFREEFPTHPKAPGALMAEASMYENELKNYQQAGDLYRELADVYPDDSLAPVSLFRYAELLRVRLSSLSAALVVYEEILSEYGEEPESGIPALEGLATISREMRQYDAAVVYYLDIHERYSSEEERVVAAILEAADIYESRLKNIDAAIHTLHIILDNYPDYPGVKTVQRKVQRLQKKQG